MNGNGWSSKFVTDWMDMSNKKSSKIFICHIDENYIHTQRDLKGKLYTTKIKEFMRRNKKSPNILYDVFIPEDKTLFPSCSCHSYCSYRLPCIHIARVYMDLIDRMYHNKHTIHPYWHVTYHPLFKEVKKKSMEKQVLLE